MRGTQCNYIIETYGLNVLAPTSWVVSDLTPEGLLGYQTLEFRSGNWKVTMKHAVVLNPSYSVSVEYVGENGFTWDGIVDFESVEESETTLQHQSEETTYYSPVDARDIALKYIQRNHPEVTAELPSEWEETNLVPAGIVGATKIQFRGGGWTVTVSAPVVWKPTYSLEVSLEGAVGLRWSGVLPTGGEVAEAEAK